MNVLKAASTDASSSGRCAPSSPTNSHVDRRRVDARLRELACDERRVDCVDRGHLGWIERDVEPGAESDLDDVAGQRVDGAAPELHDLARPEQLVGDAGHDLVRPEAHGGSLRCRARARAGAVRRAGEELHEPVGRRIGPLLQHGRGGAADRVVEHQRARVGQAEARRHRRRDRRELRGGDHHARAPGLLELDGVVDAVRGAAAAVGGAGDHDVGLGEDLLEDVGRARDRRVRRPSLRSLLGHQLEPCAGARRQRLRRARHHERGVGLAVVEHRDAQACERRRRRREVHDVGTGLAVGEIDGHRPLSWRQPSTGRVTLRVMPHDGTSSVCLPGPPATSTRMLPGSPVMGSRWSSGTVFIHCVHASSSK